MSCSVALVAAVVYCVERHDEVPQFVLSGEMQFASLF
jgi:hypothetical protein